MLQTYKASTLGEVLTIVRRLRRSWNPTRGEEELWFRGADKAHSLVPSLYRPQEQCSRYNEVTLFEAFKALGSPLAPRSAISNWDWYFLARHHGLPTRLLDWSSNISAALFFALEPHVRNKTRAEIDRLAAVSSLKLHYDDESPVLWVLEARTLNDWSVREAAIIAVNDSLDSFLPDSVSERNSGADQWPNRKPLAIYPRHSNARIVAQAGRFTIHGAIQTPLEKIAKRTGVKLARILLPKGKVANMWDDLDTAGVNRATLLQDLDSLVQYLKYCHDHS